MWDIFKIILILMIIWLAMLGSAYCASFCWYSEKHTIVIKADDDTSSNITTREED